VPAAATPLALPPTRSPHRRQASGVGHYSVQAHRQQTVAWGSVRVSRRSARVARPGTPDGRPASQETAGAAGKDISRGVVPSSDRNTVRHSVKLTQVETPPPHHNLARGQIRAAGPADRRAPAQPNSRSTRATCSGKSIATHGARAAAICPAHAAQVVTRQGFRTSASVPPCPTSSNQIETGNTKHRLAALHRQGMDRHMPRDQCTAGLDQYRLRLSRCANYLIPRWANLIGLGKTIGHRSNRSVATDDPTLCSSGQRLGLRRHASRQGKTNGPQCDNAPQDGGCDLVHCSPSAATPDQPGCRCRAPAYQATIRRLQGTPHSAHADPTSRGNPTR
jgi:hypothetical protein